MKKSIRIWMIASLVMLLAVASLQAKPPKADKAPKPHHPPMMGPMMDHGMVDRMIEFGLEDKQILTIADLRTNHLKKSLPLKRELHSLMQDQMNLRKDPAANRDKIVENEKRIGELRAELQGLHIDFLSDMKKQLTDEQLEKLGDCDLFGPGSRWKGDGPKHPRGPHPGLTPPPAPEAPDAGMDN